MVRGGRLKSLFMQCTEHKQDTRMDFFSQLSDRRTGLRGTVEMHVESLQLCPRSSDSGKALERTPKAVVRSTMQNMITLTCWESQPPLEKHFVLYRRGNKTAKLCQGLVTQEKQKNIYSALLPVILSFQWSTSSTYQTLYQYEALSIFYCLF